MTDGIPETIEIAKTIPSRVKNSSLGGHSYVDEQGRSVLQLQISEDGNRAQLVSFFEGDTVEFAGATWTVTKVYEPRPTPRGAVATLTRVG